MMQRTLGVFIALLCVAGLCSSVFASSHREAPYITEIPKCDGTDFYMFRSYDDLVTGQNTTVLIANFIPLQDPNGGPNYFFMDPEALYEIHIDNNADAKEDITFQFRFKNQFANAQGVPGIELPLIAFVSNPAVSNAFPPLVDINNDGSKFLEETYTVTLVQGDRRKGTKTVITDTNGNAQFVKPLDNLGTRTIPNYDAYAASHTFTIALPGGLTGTMFVGQRREPFIVELGGVFDSINVDSVNGGGNSNDNNALRFKSVTSFILQLPTAFLLGNNNTNGIIGGWYTASLRQARILNPFPRLNVGNTATVEGGAFSQVSRLGMPLTNELLIGVQSKDRFNASKPKDDKQFEQFVLNSNLAVALNLAVPGLNIPATNRVELSQVFLTGLPGLNQNGSFGEMQRLNTNQGPVAYDPVDGDRLGAFDANNPNIGFPNGRRPADDVVDIELTAVASPGLNPLNLVEDGALANFALGVYYLDTFPFIVAPKAGDRLQFVAAGDE